jgi:hypothetical protein
MLRTPAIVPFGPLRPEFQDSIVFGDSLCMLGKPVLRQQQAYNEHPGEYASK